MSEFNVELLSCTENPQTISVAGALACFEEESSAQLMRELQKLPEEQRLKKERAVLKNSFGRGHGSVGDQNFFIFSIEDIPRAATFQLCLLEYLAHLQQSLRRAKASRGFYLPKEIKESKVGGKVERLLVKSFVLYEAMCQNGIPGEDARYLLPLYTKTNIQTGGNARELCHVWMMSRNPGVPLIAKAVIDEMISQATKKAPFLFDNFGFNYETLAWYPSCQLYSLGNPLFAIFEKRGKKNEGVTLIDRSLLALSISEEMIREAVEQRNETQLANLKHVHFEFLVSMSLASLHQAIRQRTWNHTVESVYEAVNDALASTALGYVDKRMVTPPSIKKSPFYEAYRKQHKDMLALFEELCKEGFPRYQAIGVIPHSLKIWTLIHVNGWNAIHSIGKRTCETAQWEIRRLAWKMARLIKKELPELGQWAEPQCMTYGSCPEIEACEYFNKRQPASKK